MEVASSSAVRFPKDRRTWPPSTKRGGNDALTGRRLNRRPHRLRCRTSPHRLMLPLSLRQLRLLLSSHRLRHQAVENPIFRPRSRTDHHPQIAPQRHQSFKTMSFTKAVAKLLFCFSQNVAAIANRRSITHRNTKNDDWPNLNLNDTNISEKPCLRPPKCP
jgi:hypothetical protein